MNLPFLKGLVRDTWQWILLLFLIAGAAVYLYLREHAAPPASDHPQTAVSQETTSDEAAPAAEEPRQPRPTEQDQARDAIAEYQRRLDDDPKHEDAPALLNAMANLSRQKLGDYREAARYYELLLHDYPAWPNIAKVYPQLATCYERLGDLANLRWVYKQMMEKFPPDSQEYLYAKSELGL